MSNVFNYGRAIVLAAGMAFASQALAQEGDDETNIGARPSSSGEIIDPAFLKAYEYQSLKDGKIRIDGAINDGTLAKVSTLINYLDKNLPPDHPITFIINSSGGMADAGNAIADKIKSLTRPTISIAEGTAQSIAFSIFMAADKRQAYPSTIFMQHPISFQQDGLAKPTEAEKKEIDAIIAYQNRLADIELTGRTKLSDPQIKTMFGSNCFFGTEFALKHGFATEVLAPKGVVLKELPTAHDPKPIMCSKWPEALKLAK